MHYITLYYIMLCYIIWYCIEFWMLIAFTSLHRSTVPHESKWLVHVKTRTVCFHNYSDLPITNILSMTHPLKAIGVSCFWILFQIPIYLIEFLEYVVFFLKSSYAGIICYYSEVCWRGYTLKASLIFISCSSKSRRRILGIFMDIDNHRKL